MSKYVSAEQRYGKELAESAEFFRSIAFEIDENPDAILKYIENKTITSMLQLKNINCLEKVKLYEALGYGDAGALLACPGPSLSGMMLDELGTEDQRQQFYDHIEKNRARSFLAVTEPNCGSNLQLMSTHLKQFDSKINHYFLEGEKWLVGHGATGSIGVVIARLSPGPLGIISVLLTPDILDSDPCVQLERTVLPMVGLRGARLGRLIFRNLSVPKQNVLGTHLSATSRGMMGLIKTFNRMRPCVGALAVGVSQAVLDYLYQYEMQFSLYQLERLQHLSIAVNLSRQLLHSAAEQVEKNPHHSGLSSLAKLKATQTVEDVTRQAFEFFPKGSRFEHPWLEKWYRDAWGFEYMEGTENMHKLNIFRSFRVETCVN